MKKNLLLCLFFGLGSLSLFGQSTTITPTSTKTEKSTSGTPLVVGMRSGYTGYIDFSRSGSFSAGIVNSTGPMQLKLGIASDHNGINNYNDIVIDSASRNIGFGTNNPQYKYHFYSTTGNGKILLESYGNYPFIFFKGASNSNQGLSWYTRSGGIIGFLLHNSSTKKMHWGFDAGSYDITIDSTSRNIGIGTESPTNAKLHVYGYRTITGPNLKIEEPSTGGTGWSAAMDLVKDNLGGSLIGVLTSAGGFNVANASNYSSWAPVSASAFNVSSDFNVKKEIVNLESEVFDDYLQQIRNIQSATYRYAWEDSETRKNNHIGFIAQSLPKEVVTEMSATPNGASKDVILGYNLSDMIGLNVLGIKAVDSKLQKLEEIIKLQQEQIELLKSEIAKLK